MQAEIINIMAKMMNFRKLICLVVLAVAGILTVAAQQMPAIPVDPDVRIGKLDNGLTYYIRHNNWPERLRNGRWFICLQ